VSDEGPTGFWTARLRGRRAGSTDGGGVGAERGAVRGGVLPLDSI
jgi:hypothetical protein